MKLTMADLLPGTLYVIQVRANDGTNLSEWSPAFDFTTMEDTTLPKVPTNVTWTVVGDAFYAEWDSMGENVNNDYAVITRYEVELIGNSVTKIISVPQITESRNSYTLAFEENKSLFGSPAASVRIRVRSVDIKDLKSDWSTPITVANDVPSPPASASTISGIGNIQVNWEISPSDDVVSYNVYAGITAGFTPSPANRFFSGSATTFLYTVPTTDTQYFKIRAVDKFGQESSDTTTSGNADSPFEIDITPPNAPTDVTVVSGGIDSFTQQQSIDVSWTLSSSTDVSRYEIRYANNTSGPWQVMSVGADTNSARIEGLSSGWEYYVAVRAVDYFANESTWVNASVYPLPPTFDTTPPSKPAAPTAAVGVQKIQVTISGLKDGGGDMEQDVEHYQVFASNVPGFTPSDSNMIGRIDNGPAMVGTFQIPAGNSSPGVMTEGWYVAVKAVDFSSNVSVASNQTSALVGLILTANIGDAQITSAKITTLEANKITAGTGIIANLIVKSFMQLGDASNNGTIYSYDYTSSAGNAGFYLSNTGLIIKTGQIEAAALRIQDGVNMMIPKYADFEASPTSYNLYNGTAGQTQVINTSLSKYNSQHLRNSWSSALGAPSFLYLADNPVDYNINVEAGAQYIISSYVWNTGAVTTSVAMGLAYVDESGTPLADTTISASSINASTAVGSATRLNGVVTAPAGAVKARVFFTSSTLTANGGYNIDGIQVERKATGATTPSQWKPPGGTSIDGSLIRTGQIQSSIIKTINGQSQPQWAINMSGGAQFSDLWVRGSMIVGAPAEDTGTTTPDQAGSSIASYNYVPDSTGWAVMSNGTAEFFNVKARGDIEASSIKANTIISDTIIAQGSGGIHAYGTRGEDVGMTGAGFQMLGAYEIALTNIVSTTTNVLTLTTSGVHGFTAGNSVIITDSSISTGPLAGTSIDNEYTIVSTPSSSTFTISYTTATFSSSIMKGLAQSMATGVNNSTRPLLIDLPTDGARPNIVSGKLAATTLSVSKATSLQGATVVENGTVTVSKGVTAPSLAPTLSAHWNSVNSTSMMDTTGLVERSGLTIGPDGHYWFVDLNESLQVTAKKVNNSTGAFMDTQAITTLTDYTGRVANINGIVYNPVSNNFHVGITFFTGSNAWLRIRTYSSTWTFIGNNDFSLGSGTIISYAGFGGKYFNEYLYPSIGWDYINSKLTLAYYMGTYAVGDRHRYTDFTMSSGRPTTMATTFPLGGTDIYTPMQITHTSTTNNMDGGVLSHITLGFVDGQFIVFDDFMFREDGFEWFCPPGTTAMFGAAYNNTKKQTFGFTNNFGIVEFATGEYVWYDTKNAKTKSVYYSWYDSIATKTANVQSISSTSTTCTVRLASGHGLVSGDVVAGTYIEVSTTAGARFNGMVQIASANLGASPATITYNKSGATVGLASTTGTVKISTNETTPSPVGTILLPKRAKIRATILQIPYSTSGVVPDMARIYLNAISSSSVRLMTTVSYPSTVVTIPDQAVNPTFIIPTAATNTFSSLNFPSEIRSGSEDNRGPIISIKGSGAGRAGPISWDELGNPLISRSWIGPVAAPYQNLIVGVNSAVFEVAQWTVTGVPTGASIMLLSASCNASCPAGNQAVNYWLSVTLDGTNWFDVATVYNQNHGAATSDIGATFSVLVNVLGATNLKVQIRGQTGGGAGNTYIGMTQIQTSFLR